MMADSGSLWEWWWMMVGDVDGKGGASAPRIWCHLNSVTRLSDDLALPAESLHTTQWAMSSLSQDQIARLAVCCFHWQLSTVGHHYHSYSTITKHGIIHHFLPNYCQPNIWFSSFNHYKTPGKIEDCWIKCYWTWFLIVNHVQKPSENRDYCQ